MSRVLVGVKRVIDYAVKVNIMLNCYDWCSAITFGLLPYVVVVVFIISRTVLYNSNAWNIRALTEHFICVTDPCEARQVGRYY